MLVIKKFRRKVREVGWEKLPSALRKHLLYKISQMRNKITPRLKHIRSRIKKIPETFYLRIVYQNRTVARQYPFKKPAILLLAHPRSGSTWMAHVLCSTTEVAFLGEPITQTFIEKFGYGSPFLDPHDKDINKKYKRIADQAFSGIPPIYQAMNGNTADFFPFTKELKHLLIKEVNPLAADFFNEHYAPKVIILLRHPAGIVDSYMRMGWLNKNFEEFSYRYGMWMNNVIHACKKGSYTIQLYEDIATKPLEQFKNLFDFMEISVPSAFDKIIEKYCKQKNDKWDPWNTERVSDHEVHKWKYNLDEDIIEAVKKGYLKSDLDYYRNRKDWEYKLVEVQY